MIGPINLVLVGVMEIIGLRTSVPVSALFLLINLVKPGEIRGETIRI